MSPGAGDLPLIVSRITPQAGPCKKCRHANQGTQDMKSGYVACRFKGGVMRDAVCDLAIQKRETGETVGYCFEEFDGKNGTWGIEARIHFEPREPQPPRPAP